MIETKDNEVYYSAYYKGMYTEITYKLNNIPSYQISYWAYPTNIK